MKAQKRKGLKERIREEKRDKNFWKKSWIRKFILSLIASLNVIKQIGAIDPEWAYDATYRYFQLHRTQMKTAKTRISTISGYLDIYIKDLEKMEYYAKSKNIAAIKEMFLPTIEI